jgi:hypothetical protein
MPRGRAFRRGGESQSVALADTRERMFAERVAHLPEPVQPLFRSLRDYIREQAEEYVRSTPQPHTPLQMKAFLIGFLKQLEFPLEFAQRLMVAAAYRWPLPDNEFRTKAGIAASSAGAAGAGQASAYGSWFNAMVVSLCLGVAGEMIEFYALASARTTTYLRAGIRPGEKVIADDLAQILKSKRMLVRGTTRHVGDEGFSMFLEWVEREISGSILIPVVGPVRSGYRSWNNLSRVYHTPLSDAPSERASAEPEPPDFVMPTFAELFARYQRTRGGPLQLGPGPS